MCTVEVVTSVGTASNDIEIDQEVVVGEVFTSHTDVECIAFTVCDVEVVGSVTGDHTRHCIVGWVQWCVTNPVRVVTIDSHDVRLEGWWDVCSTCTVCGNQGHTNSGCCTSEVRCIEAEEVGFVDGCGCNDADLRGVERVTNAGNVCVRACVDLCRCSRPGEVLNRSDRLNSVESGGCSRSTAVPSELGILCVDTNITGSVEWVNPRVITIDHVETGTCASTINRCTDCGDCCAVSVDTSGGSGNGCVTVHGECSRFDFNTVSVSSDGGSVKVEIVTWVHRWDTDSGCGTGSNEGWINVSNVTAIEDHSVVTDGDGVVLALDGNLVTVVEAQSNCVRCSSTGTDTDGVVLDFRSAVSACRCTVVDSDVRTTVSPSVSDLESVLSSNTVGSEAVVCCVRGERTSSPGIGRTIRLGDFKSDFATPVVGFKIDIDRDSRWDSEGTTGLWTVRVRSNRTQGGCWSWRARSVFHVDTAVSIQQRVVGDDTVSSVSFDSCFTVLCSSDDFVVIDCVVIDSQHLNRSLRPVEVVVLNSNSLVVSSVCSKSLFSGCAVEPVSGYDQVVGVTVTVNPYVSDFSAVEELVSFDS